MSEVLITNRPESARYEIVVDGTPTGFVTYELEPGLISFLHAEIDPSMEGRGYGSRLVGFALDDARGRELEVLPVCPFVRAYIRSHPRHLALVPESARARPGL